MAGETIGGGLNPSAVNRLIKGFTGPSCPSDGEDGSLEEDRAREPGGPAGPADEARRRSQVSQ
eukprot:2074054-Pyramimonas_sp.AAC.1